MSVRFRVPCLLCQTRSLEGSACHYSPLPAALGLHSSFKLRLGPALEPPPASLERRVSLPSPPPAALGLFQLPNRLPPHPASSRSRTLSCFPCPALLGLRVSFPMSNHFRVPCVICQIRPLKGSTSRFTPARFTLGPASRHPRPPVPPPPPPAPPSPQSPVVKGCLQFPHPADLFSTPRLVFPPPALVSPWN